MSEIVYLDTNVFIWAYNRPKSNSKKIIRLLTDKKITGIVSEKVLEELDEYFLRIINEKTAFKVSLHVKLITKIIPREKYFQEMNKLKGKIKEKDLEHIATVRKLKISKLISYDRDFESFEEYYTPKQFIKSLGLKTSETEY